ncbi:PREDICTED: uncharacterized protein LOC103327136 [Prunus mume]|uniref:Uncharacterized protein LOC103327136 n=1 Tax=Prunus mume TaxID=102107 RepID=A0ABM0NP02_PRUMU|nr:PREDICTED: uncharacterized protein LOC103327136 [Prunus mume]
MERYFKRRFASTTSSSDNVGSSSLIDVGISTYVDSSKESGLQDILANLIADLGLRPQMLDYDPNIRDEVRRAYLQKGSCQPKDHTFPQTDLSGIGQGRNNAFTEMGFRNWKKDKIRQHVGAVGTSLDCVRCLLRQGLPFRGYDKSDTSSNKGNYLELFQFLADHDEKVKAVVLENAPGNLKLIAPTVQKDLVNACATETIKKIIKDMDGAFFSLLVDESCDVDTTSNSLKEAIDTLFSREELCISMLRGQGCDGASNMKGEFNGNADIATFFTSCNSLVNIVGASRKRRDMLRDQLQKDVTEALEKDTFPTGQGLNQETCLKRPGDTRWNSHYGTLLSIISIFKSVVKVLKLIIEDGSTDNLGEANRSLREIQSFEFVFQLFFMRSTLRATNDLSQASLGMQ